MTTKQNSKERVFYVGLLHFDSEPGKEVEEKLNALPVFADISGRKTKIVAEHVLVHEISLDYQTRYSMIIDRSSHRLSQAVGILKLFAYRGVHVVNNPLSFWWFVSSKDAGYGMMRDVGVRVPKTYLLPQRETPYLAAEEFKYHRLFDWEGMVRNMGWPCYIKPNDGRGAIGCHEAWSMEELIGYYNESGSKVMMVQQGIDSPHEWHVRCLCVGRKVIPMKFIFRPQDYSEYIFEPDFLDAKVHEDIVQQCMVINRAFGYEMNSVEFVFDRQGTPWAIDFNNPVPDGRSDKLGKEYYSAYINALVSVVIDKAYFAQTAQFLPPLNTYANIARLPLPKEERFALAFQKAVSYYQPEQSEVLAQIESTIP